MLYEDGTNNPKNASKDQLNEGIYQAYETGVDPDAMTIIQPFQGPREINVQFVFRRV